MDATTPTLGLTEQEYRDELEQELIRAMRAEGGVPTIHAIAHAVARVAELDHLRLADQLAAAGLRLEHEAAAPPGAGSGWPMD
ncbi:MAG TPA: hypothetical protein VK874_11575 [Gaiellaceae bacterium]|nr:hypothetical protein [Gaiellaceae bacterium]